MTSEYGAASQLEKIDMLDFADLIALNKFEKRGAEDALRDVRKQWRRNRVAFTAPDDQVPVYPTIASRFNDPGVNKLFAALCARLDSRTGETGTWHVADPGPTELVERHALVPARRSRYLAEISGNGRRAREDAQHRAPAASRAQSLHEALRTLRGPAAACAARALSGGYARRDDHRRRRDTTARRVQRRARCGRDRRRHACCGSGRRRPRRQPMSSTCTRCAARRFAATTTSAR